MCTRWMRILSFTMTGIPFFALALYFAQTKVAHERAAMCMTENLYHEGRGQTAEDQYILGMLTLARVFDSDPQWPKTICGAIGQDKAFSWVLDYRLATKRSEKEKWQKAEFIARDLLENAWVRYAMPKGWECARWYKRTDGKGVSKASMKFFETRLFPVGTFGAHTAFQERRGCKKPMPTA